MVYVFAGSNWFGIKTATDQLVTDFLAKNDQLAIERFDGNEDEQAEFVASLSSVSLFSEQKLVIIHSLSAYKSLADDIEAFLDKIDDDTTLLIIEKQPDKRSSYYKKLSKLASFKEFAELNENTLADWLVQCASDLGGQINRSDAAYLIDRVGNSQTSLDHELNKLVQYNPQVNRQTIDLLTDQTIKSKIFDLVNYAFTGQCQKALQVYDEQRKLRTEPQAILGMLVWQMHLVAVCATSNQPASEIARETKLNSFTLSKSEKIARAMGRGQVSQFLKLLTSIDLTSKKQTYNLDDALKLAIVSLAK